MDCTLSFKFPRVSHLRGAYEALIETWNKAYEKKHGHKPEGKARWEITLSNDMEDYIFTGTVLYEMCLADMIYECAKIALPTRIPEIMHIPKKFINKAQLETILKEWNENTPACNFRMHDMQDYYRILGEIPPLHTSAYYAKLLLYYQNSTTNEETTRIHKIIHVPKKFISEDKLETLIKEWNENAPACDFHLEDTKNYYQIHGNIPPLQVSAYYGKLLLFCEDPDLTTKKETSLFGSDSSSSDEEDKTNQAA